MNKQRKVVITTTYNEMGIIIDTKAEEVVQPEPAVWLMDGIVHGEVMHRCSECGEQEHVPLVMGLPSWRYCPNCGLKMEANND